MKEKRIKKLNAIERMHLRQPNANVILTAKIHPILQKETVKQSISKLTHVHPLISSTISIDDNNDAWFITKKDCTIPIIETENQSWEQLVCKEIQKKYDIFNGLLINLTICNNESDSYLIINAHHVICDGLALVYFLKDLLNTMNNLNEHNESLIPPSLNQDTIPINYSNFFIKSMIGITNKKWFKENIELTESGFENVHENFWIKHNPKIHHWMISEKQSKHFIQCCKKNNVSVNSALTTAFMISQDHVEKNKDYLKNIVISVDFRNRLIASAGE